MNPAIESDLLPHDTLRPDCRRPSGFKISTPALILSESEIVKASRAVKRVSTAGYFEVLYSLKPLSMYSVLELVASEVDGFSVSSPFEAMLARESGGHRATIHYSSPGLQPRDVSTVLHCCNAVSFNSLGQYRALVDVMADTIECGIRINPRLSFVNDKRYDPCRPDSRLGIPIDQIEREVEKDISQFRYVNGLHFHNNCDSTDLSGYAKTVLHLEGRLPRLFSQLKWINLGGGYIVTELSDTTPLKNIVEYLHAKYGVTVFMEPGASIVRSAGYLVASVVDIVRNNGKAIAILDTTVNHMPEVFEYQFEPDVLGHRDDGKYEYIFAGCSCLAGDILGTYAFDEPVRVGQRVVVKDMGAYTLVKANMFNGICLPNIYLLKSDGELSLVKEFGYEDYLSTCGAVSHESV